MSAPPDTAEAVGTCETCSHWTPNTCGRIMGWCGQFGPPPANPLFLVLGEGRRAYNDTCGQHQSLTEYP